MTFLNALLRQTSIATLIAASAVAQLQNDTRADYQAMFLPSGPQGQVTQFSLRGGAPPVIGQMTSMQINAPGFVFGGLVGSFGADTARPMVVGGQQLLTYVDLGIQLGNVGVRLPGGVGQMQWHVPLDHRLVGVDLAWQAWGVDAQGRIGTSNLLLCNLGQSALSGSAVFANFQFGPVSVSGNSYYNANNKKQAIISNETTSKVNYTVTGTKPAGSGPLEMRDDTGAVVSTVAAADAIISKTISVPAAGKVYWYNNSGAAINNLQWSIQAH